MKEMRQLSTRDEMELSGDGGKTGVMKLDAAGMKAGNTLFFRRCVQVAVNNFFRFFR